MGPGKMQPDATTGTADFNDYLNTLTHSWLKILTLLAFLLIPLFIVLDYFIVPALLFERFVYYRLSATALLILQHLIIRSSQPRRTTLLHGYFASAVISLMITVMTVNLGGFDSSYYAGLNLIIIAVNLLLPWKPVHSGANSLTIIGYYIIFNAIFGGRFQMTNLLNNLYFLSSTIFITICISYLRYNLTKKEFTLRAELARAQVDRIHDLANISQIVASGDLSVTIEKKSESTAGILESAFDTMIRNLQNAILQIKEISDYINEYGQNISTSTEAMALGAKALMNQTKESSETIKKMTDTIIMNSRKAAETDHMADKAISTASQSGRFVDESVAAMNQIAETVKNTADKVNSLGRSSEKINEIAQVINDIANQTNLLALNASIEAAHHGEEGRGFAIVADEVGKLSERTTAATREITEMVKNVLSDIKGAMTSMNSVTGEVDNSIRLFHQMNRSMNEIVDLSNSLRGMISGIASAGKEQSDAASLINENITSINDISLEFAVLIERIAQAIDNMLNLTINLEKMVNRFKLK